MELENKEIKMFDEVGKFIYEYISIYNQLVIFFLQLLDPKLLGA